MSKKDTTRFVLNPKKLPRLSSAEKKRLNAMHDEDIDYSDIPALTDAFWNHAKILKPTPKQMVSFRVDVPVLGWFRKQGKGYQSYMNAVLRAFVEANSHSQRL